MMSVQTSRLASPLRPSVHHRDIYVVLYDIFLSNINGKKYLNYSYLDTGYVYMLDGTIWAFVVFPQCQWISDALPFLFVSS